MSEWSISMSCAVFDPGAAHMSKIWTKTHESRTTMGNVYSIYLEEGKYICTDSKWTAVIWSACADLVVGLNLQEKRWNHADSFLSADVSLKHFQTLNLLLKVQQCCICDISHAIFVWLTDSVSLTRNWWNFSSRGDFLIIFLLMLVCQACSSGYLEAKDTSSFVSAECLPLDLTTTVNEVSPAESLRSLDLLPINLHVLNILEVFVLKAVEDFLGMAGMWQKTKGNFVLWSTSVKIIKPLSVLRAPKTFVLESYDDERCVTLKRLQYLTEQNSFNHNQVATVVPSYCFF